MNYCTPFSIDVVIYSIYNIEIIMKNLTSAQRSYLKSEAHHLNPIIFIGKNGLVDGTIESINMSLKARELIKIKFQNFKDDKERISNIIATQTNSSTVGIIGHSLILFRQNIDPEKQKYKLPF